MTLRPVVHLGLTKKRKIGMHTRQAGDAMLKKMDVARIRVVLTCMLANNVTFGLVYGSFGAFLASNEQAFGVGRATISFGMSAAATTLALSALVLGNYTNKLQPRRMIARLGGPRKPRKCSGALRTKRRKREHEHQHGGHGDRGDHGADARPAYRLAGHRRRHERWRGDLPSHG